MYIEHQGKRTLNSLVPIRERGATRPGSTPAGLRGQRWRVMPQRGRLQCSGYRFGIWRTGYSLREAYSRLVNKGGGYHHPLIFALRGGGHPLHWSFFSANPCIINGS